MAMLLLMKVLLFLNLFPAMLLSLVSVCTHYWIQHSNEEHQGLWKFCNFNGCHLFEEDLEVSVKGVPDWHNAVLGLMAAATFLQIGSFLSFIFVWANKRCGCCNVLVVILASLAWICVSSGMAVYTQKFYHLVNKETGYEWGFSFLLGWLSFVLNFFSCIFSLVYLMLEERKSREMWS